MDLCTRAFSEDFSTLFQFVQSADHVLAYRDDTLVGHALWSTRWFQVDEQAPLRTAYVDAVASDPGRWRTGIGSAVMRRLARETDAFEIRGLATGIPRFYQRLGWELWPGPRGVRTEAGVELTPADPVMIMTTPKTPTLNRNGLLTVEWRDGHNW